ncbi:MAG: NADH-quinone oxidoreductase subunit NuoK [Candidatus Bathyarchaeia archaeon]
MRALMENLVTYLSCALVLFVIGLYCLVAKRNMVRLVIGLEILINAANLSFIAFSTYRQSGYVDLLSQSVVVLSMAMAGSVTALALVILLNAYKHYKTLDIRELRRLRR